MIRRFSQRIQRALQYFRTNGLRATLARVQERFGPEFYSIESLVKLEDVERANWAEQPQWAKKAKPVDVTGGARVAWIMSPPGAESGGHQNIVRFIRVMEQHGHQCTIYLYAANGRIPSESNVREMMANSDAYADIEARILPFPENDNLLSEYDAIFATGWETAYPAFNDSSAARRLYFVQDFEPSFFATGSDSLLAENTYHFGFRAITAGGWLAHKLATEYGMSTSHFDFAVDPNNYYLRSDQHRSDVFFYARPVTPRRAFEFGVTVLAEFRKLVPDTTIHFAGWDVSEWKLPFDFENHGSLQLSQLNDLYNRCASALVLSLSNMSLLPLELIASGVRPVVNDGANNRMVSENPYIDYSPPVPHVMAERLALRVREPVDAKQLLAMHNSVANFTWQDAGSQFIRAFEEQMRG